MPFSTPPKAEGRGWVRKRDGHGAEALGGKEPLGPCTKIPFREKGKNERRACTGTGLILPRLADFRGSRRDKETSGRGGP